MSSAPLFAGDLMEAVHHEVLASWDRADLAAQEAGFDTSVLVAMAGCGLSRVEQS